MMNGEKDMFPSFRVKFGQIQQTYRMLFVIGRGLDCT